MKNINVNKKILIILLIALAIRLIKFPHFPSGFSIEEIKFGLAISQIWASLPREILFIRLPFLIFGLFSIYLSYKLAEKIFNERVALICAATLAILPWHTYLSRVGNEGILVFTALLLIFWFLVVNVGKDRTAKIFFALAAMLLFFSLVNIVKSSTVAVNDQRHVASMSDFPRLAVLSNKLTVSIRIFVEKFFEYLDIGNYFFNGQPRPRLGVQEIQKAYVFMLPLLIIGFLRIKKENMKIILAASMFSISLSFLFASLGPTENVLFMFILASLISIGAMNAGKRSLLVIFFVGIFEIGIFLPRQFDGYEESRFSPYKPFYQDMVDEANSREKDYNQVLINDSIINANIVFDFFASRQLSEKLKIVNFDTVDFNKQGVMFVDFLQGAPGPSDRLYVESGGYPQYVDLIEEFTDKSTNEKIIIYR